MEDKYMHIRRWKDYMSGRTVCKRILSVEEDNRGELPEIEVDRYRYTAKEVR